MSPLEKREIGTSSASHGQPKMFQAGSYAAFPASPADLVVRDFGWDRAAAHKVSPTVFCSPAGTPWIMWPRRTGRRSFAYPDRALVSSNRESAHRSASIAERGKRRKREKPDAPGR